MNHGFESQINLSGSDDLGYILWSKSAACNSAQDYEKAYTRIIRLQESNFDSLILEITLGLSQVQRSVVRRGVPFQPECQPTISNKEKTGQPNQFVKKVILSEDMVALVL